ncbi:YcaO-like family protein [Rhizobium multihospitium]|uniref:Ribosomal protein S12 methylthiotransferase accessory factor n=1 Tax=Rhizobium multihospitium TaxID=410764 RepID=A0A1C3W226_9HYPH|nr:YcaO-like family protein [Rhizobium multihospitium]SCB34080.1 ribosomal protein S12 methylthiotransferase accessory factor [Rhizobium multihospitium]
MSNSFRACSAGETLSRVWPYLGQLGITRVGRQTGLDRIGIPVWCAYAPNSKAIVVAQGKGLDDISAKTSAVMEAIERSVATRPYCSAFMASRDDLDSSSRAADCLDDLLATGAQPIEANEQIKWSEAYDLAKNASIFVPFEAIHLDRTHVSPRFWVSSDGLASGNTWHEAVLHGLLERIERDACVLWGVSDPERRYARRIDPRSIANDEVGEMLEKISAADFDLALFDVTSDLSVASVVALLRPRGDDGSLRYVDLTMGAGTSLLPDVAVARAISEAVQSRMTFIAGARDDLVPELFSRRADPAHLQSFGVQCATKLDELPMLQAKAAPDALDQLVKTHLQHDIDQLYAIELAPEWLPASVAKVFAPQLEHPDGDRRMRFGSRAFSASFA